MLWFATLVAAERASSNFCLVLGPGRLVLGRLRGDALDADDARSVTDVMENGPTTIRPDEDLAALIGRMQKRRVTSIIVTDPEGHLIGVLDREDGERALRDITSS